MKRSIRGLTSDKRVVYVRLSDEKVAELFFAMARYEGFTIDGELLGRRIRECCYVRLNEDGSISYPRYSSWTGALRFYHAKTENGKRVVKYDFESLMKGKRAQIN